MPLVVTITCDSCGQVLNQYYNPYLEVSWKGFGAKERDNPMYFCSNLCLHNKIAKGALGSALLAEVCG